MDDPGFLGQRQELRRQQRAPLGMVPADQRLDADQRAGGAIDLRLIADLQLALDQRGRSSASAWRRRRSWRSMPGSKKQKRFRPPFLARYSAMSARCSSCAGVVPVGRHHRDADAHGHLRLAPVQIERLGQHVDDPPAQALDVRRTVDVALQHGELVAALTGHACRCRAGRRAGARAQRARRRSPEAWPDAVVDLLEPVEVEAEHGSTGAMPPAARHDLAQPLAASAHGWAGR